MDSIGIWPSVIFSEIYFLRSWFAASIVLGAYHACSAFHAGVGDLAVKMVSFVGASVTCVYRKATPSFVSRSSSGLNVSGVEAALVQGVDVDRLLAGQGLKDPGKTRKVL